MCQQGFDDALHFLHRNNLISCTRCLAIQSTFIFSKQTPEHYDPQCTTCSFHRDESLIDKSLPDAVLIAMEKYIMAKSHSGFFRWLQQPALFLLRTFSIPVRLPCDLVYAAFSKYEDTSIRCNFYSNVLLSSLRILSTAPSVTDTMWGYTKVILDNVHQILNPNHDSFIGMETYADQIKSMYDKDPILKKFEHVSRRRSIVDLCPSDVEESDFEVRGNVLSRRNSAVPSIAAHHNAMSGSGYSQVGDVETLDQVANVASHHDTLYSYHYMDETDKTVSSADFLKETMNFNYKRFFR